MQSNQDSNRRTNHDGYSPSDRLEHGYQPAENVAQPAPTALPTTGSSVISPSVGTDQIQTVVETQNDGG